MDELLFMISNRDINIPDFTELVLNDKPARDFIVNQMVTNKDINIYYNCYLISAPACERQPGLFYEYIEQITGLFQSNTSYHHNIAMEFIGALAAVDDKGYCEDLLKIILPHLNSSSLITKRYCVKSLGKIALAKKKLNNSIVNALLSIDAQYFKNARQAALLNSDIIEVLLPVYPYLKNKKDVHAFAEAEARSISPRTKKMAKEFLKKYPA